jgi:hypothetical protein
MSRAPEKLYRLWCGKKLYTPWLSDQDELWRIALREGLAYGDARGIGLGPLTWIQHGERKHPKGRTIVIGQTGLPRRHRDQAEASPLPAIRAPSRSYR